MEFIKNFKRSHKELPIEFILIDDESYDVKNRISLISTNGLIGFILIILVLFFFLDFRSGIWVAMGIPFSLAFTLICLLIIGYTINNMTLASIIIVLGIVVDDAIIIAENITRRKNEHSHHEQSRSILEMASPILASVLTTCVAFIPLYFFEGRFGLFVKYIPAVIFIMLTASVFESFFILPNHMISPSPFFSYLNSQKIFIKISQFRDNWVAKCENLYARILFKILHFRVLTLLFFTIILLSSFYIFHNNLKYVMFPKEESRDFKVKVYAQDGVTKYEMAKIVESLENIFLEDKRGIVQSVLTEIGQNRRGGEVKENEGTLSVEISPPTERKESLNELLKDWEEKSKNLPQITKVRFMRNRFGSESGSSIEIEIQENNDIKREKIVSLLESELKKFKNLTNVEIEKPLLKKEFRLGPNGHEVNRLGISLDELASTLRTYIEGDILYTMTNDEEEVDIRLTCKDSAKNSINQLLNLTVPNKENYLVPIKNVVQYTQNTKPANIQRSHFKRVTKIFADIDESSSQSPLEVAEKLEADIFPQVLESYPTTNIQFTGEIKDSRESQSEFSLSIFLVIGLIYLLLIFLFDSFSTPLLIAIIIPFGLVGTILAFWLHGLNQYGFFAVVGTLGMLGVVINDSIVLVSKLKREFFVPTQDLDKRLQFISQVSSTRLRAIVITTLTTVAGLFPTAYGLGGHDSMLAEMMLAMSWGLVFGMIITLFLVPILYSFYIGLKKRNNL